MWGNFLSTIGSGVVKGLGAAGRGVKKGVGALAERMGEDEGDEGMMMTPPFIPNDPLPTGRGIEIPGLTPPPSLATMRSPLPSVPARRPMPSVASPGPMMSPPAAMTPRDNTSMEDVPIPALPGRAGQHQPYSPMAKAKYDHVMRGAGPATTTPEGEFKPPSFKRSFKDIARNAVIGGLQGAASGGGWSGAAGGALAAGAGTAINPMMGREYEFESIHRPHMEQEEGKARTGRMQRYEEAVMRGRVDAIPRDAERDVAQTEHIRTQNQVAIENANRQRALTDSQIKLNEARTEAARTGKPVISDVVDADGQIRTYQIFPTGQMVEVGASAKAALQQKRTTSQEKIATGRNQSAERRTATTQAGATGRTAMSQSGADRRQAERLANQGQGQAQSKLRKPSTAGGQGAGKSVPGTDADAFAKKKKIDPAKWRDHLKKQGWTIKDKP